MIDNVFKLARDQRCIAAIVPDDNGSWLSDVDYYRYRDYLSSPLNSKSLADAIILNAGNDYVMNIVFRVYQNDIYGGIFFPFQMSNLPRIYTNFSNTVLRVFNYEQTQNYIFKSISYGEWYTLKVERTGASITYTIVETAETTTLQDSAVLVPTILNSAYYIYHNFNGNIKSFSFVGSDASYYSTKSDVYSNPYIAQPNLNMRNFSTEPATWYELKEKGLLVDPTHDFRFTFTFTLAAASLPTTTGRYLMDYGSPVAAIFGAFYANGGGISCCCGLFKSSLSGQAETAGEAITLIPNTVGVPLAAGEHTIEVYAIGNSLYAKLDEGDFVYAASMTRRTDLSILKKAPVTSHVGGVVKIELFDITDNKVIWSYPSIAEKIRLITKTNVRTDRGYFESADADATTRIATSVDLRGANTPLTLVCKAYLPLHAADGKAHVSDLIVQGNGAGSNTPIALSVWEDYRSGTVRQIKLSYLNSSEVYSSLFFDLNTTHFDRNITIAAVFDVANSAIILYVDDIEVSRKTGKILLPFGKGIGTGIVENVSILSNPSATYFSGQKIMYAMIFDEALTANEIKYLG